ncbi:MAG: hypothetical protein LBN00_09945 [Oscillospiraceae bacterium]|jgi:hypothetical protein|nr:hypothetical protein [Oscillospiraceae bacterium]
MDENNAIEPIYDEGTAELFAELGLTMPDDADASESEPDGDTGENGREPAEPADEPEQSDTPPAGGAAPMSDEERHENAARRRAAEVAEIESRARAAAIVETNAKIAALGLFDENGQAVNDADKLDAYNAQLRARQAQTAADNGELTPAVLQTLLEQTPLMQELGGVIQATKAQQEALRRQAFDTRVKAELDEIKQYEPNVKSVGDVLALEKGDAMRAYIERGLTLAEAYKLTYTDKIAGTKSAAAFQQGVRTANSTSHLGTPKAQSAAAEIHVPQSELNWWSEIHPEIKNKSELRESYLKYNKLE